MYKKYSHEITSEAVKRIINKRGFFQDVEVLTNILIPIKKAILNLESRNSNLADCYIQLLRIGASLQKISTTDYFSFKNHCIKKYNQRYIL
jgi:hypothetical protein